jgi:homocysteine S-methyltransferase
MKPDIDISHAFDEHVVVFDGAMGTEIYKRRVFVNTCFDELCLSRPELIREIHQAYCDAGADVLTTNSFGANALELARFGLAEKLPAINRSAAVLARETADSSPLPVYVAGSVGPLRLGASDAHDPSALLVEQIRSLAEGGADFVFFETLPTRMELEACVRAYVASGVSIPYGASVAVYPNGESAAGEPVDRLFAPLPDDLPMPVLWGLNCGSGPDALLSCVEHGIKVVDRPLVVQPNAGVPKEIGNRLLYMCSPEYMASYARRYVELGVRGVGGCCGTAPEHIREIAQSVKPLTKRRVKIEAVAREDGVQEREPSDFQQRSRLAWRLANGKWVTTVELVPPRGYDLGRTIERARSCHRHGVDAINVPDGPRASSRLSPLLTAAEIQRQAGIETILHFCCRDRNLIGMQADLFACAAAGVRNILFVTGDPPKLGNYPFASGVFDLDSVGLVGVQERLNRGIDIGGQEIDPATHAVKGVGADPNAIDMEREIRRFREKVDAGADFAITQPVFDPDALLRFLDRIQAFSIPVIAGIWPLASYRNACFMKNEVPGVVVPDEIMARMEAMDSREDQRRVGIEIAREASARVRAGVAGIQVSAPFGNVDTALAVIDE